MKLRHNRELFLGPDSFYGAHHMPPFPWLRAEPGLDAGIGGGAGMRHCGLMAQATASCPSRVWERVMSGFGMSGRDAGGWVG